MSSASRTPGPVALPPRIGRLVTALAAGLVLTVLLLLTAISWQRTVEADQEDLRDEFDFRLRDAEARITARMDAYEQVLSGAAAFLDGSPTVTRGAFRDYVSALHLQRHFPGIQGVGYAVVVPAARLDAHVAAVRREGFPDYQVRPAGPRDPYTAIVYLEPFTDRNLRAFGYDMSSEPVRRAAMEKARDEGQASLSGRVTLVQETGHDVQYGVLMYHPLYGPGPVPLTVAERRARLAGWAYMPFRMGDLMSGILGERSQDLATRVHDGPAPSGDTLLFDSAAGAAPAAPGRFSGHHALTVVDRPWTVAVASRPSFDRRAPFWRPALVAAGGVLISLLLSLLVWVLASSRDLAVGLATTTNQRLLEANAALTVSEDRLTAALQGSDDGYVDIDVARGAVYRSDRYWAIAGWPTGSLPSVPESFLALVHPEDAARVKAAVERLRRVERDALDEEYRLRGADGTYRWVRARLRTVQRDAAGRPLRVAGAISDAEESRRLRTLAVDEARLRSLAGRMNEAELVLDAQGTVVEANDQASALYGRTRDELVGLDIGALRAEETRPEMAEQLRQAAETGLRFQTWHLRRDGGRFPVEVSSRPFEVGGVRYVHSLVRDLTEQRRQEAELVAAVEALRSSEARLAHVLDGTNDGFWDWEIPTGRVIFSERWAAMLGYRVDELAPDVATWERLVHPEDLPAVMAAVKALLEDPARRYETEHRVRHRDGRWVWILDRGKVVERDAAGAPRRAAGTHTDITARKEAELALQASERRLAAALEEQSVILRNATIGITLVRQHRQIWASAQVERLLGYTAAEMQGAETVGFYPSLEAWTEFVQAAGPIITAGGAYRGECLLRRKDGSTFPARLQGRLIDPANEDVGSIWCIEDVSQVRQLSARAAQAERLASTATLARGMAHEINNPLASVTTNLFFVREQLEGAAGAAGRGEPVDMAALLGEVAQAVADAAASAARIRAIVGDLRSFALGDLPAGPPATSLAAALRDARRVAAQDLARCASLTFQVPEQEEVALAHPDLVQLLAHLLINAGQATGPAPNAVRVEAAATTSGAIELRISDTGVGMPEAVRARAFEPFFTTKDVGKGRGLGLSVCLGIVQAAGGEIELASAPGQGTTVTVRLPLAAPAAAGGAARVEA